MGGSPPPGIREYRLGDGDGAKRTGQLRDASDALRGQHPALRGRRHATTRSAGRVAVLPRPGTATEVVQTPWSRSSDGAPAANHARKSAEAAASRHSAIT